MIPCNVSPASEEIADFIVRYSPRAVDSLYELAQTRCVNLVSQEYAIVHAPLSGVLPLSFTQHTYSAIPKLYGLQDTTALEAAGILPVFSQPNLMSTGQGILIGMIDTGIDYTNPLFQNPDGTSRILRLWDQTIESENTPGSCGRIPAVLRHRLQPGRDKPRPGLRTAAGAGALH
ncbi:MAG: hypothetical protein V8S58_09155 [Lachnospiraceae bacterium]